MNREFAIETNNINKQYGKFQAVKDLNIKVKKGQVYGFIGKNGAGKTTTINMILSLLKSSSGDIFLLGDKINFYDYNYKKHIGFVSDVPVFPGYMNAYQYLKYIGDLFEINNNTLKQKINELLEFVGLLGNKRKIGGFSRGMKQRLAIAQALINDPEILIMDEPTSALDPIGRKEVMDIILKLKNEKTIFYSTHILSDVERVCDVIGIIDNGVLINEFSLNELNEKYTVLKYYISTNLENTKLVALLNKQSFCKEAYVHEKGVMVIVDNEFKAGKMIPKLLVDNEITLKEFKKQERSLEDFFIQVVENENSN